MDFAASSYRNVDRYSSCAVYSINAAAATKTRLNGVAYLYTIGAKKKIELLAMLKIRLLGTPQLYLNRASLGGAVTGRELALLAYLAVTGTLQDRSTLSTLFWPEIGEQQARKNLRNLLYSLRQSIGDYLDSNRQTVCLRRDQIDWIDVEIFSSYWINHQLDIGNQRLPEILGLYQGDFLQGFAIQDASLFEDWLLMQRRTFQDQAMHGFQHLAQHHLVAGDYRAGLGATRHLLTIAPWHESAHRLQMLLLAHSGQRSSHPIRALQQVLAEEYGVVPTAETTALYCNWPLSRCGQR